MEPTKEMIEVFGKAWHEEDQRGTHVPGARRKAGIAAVIELMAAEHVCPECFQYRGTGGETIACATCGKAGS